MPQKIYDTEHEHERMRRKLWIDAWVVTAGSNSCLGYDIATRWADEAIKAFDKRFKYTEKETDA